MIEVLKFFGGLEFSDNETQFTFKKSFRCLSKKIMVSYMLHQLSTSTKKWLAERFIQTAKWATMLQLQINAAYNTRLQIFYPPTEIQSILLQIRQQCFKGWNLRSHLNLLKFNLQRDIQKKQCDEMATVKLNCAVCKGEKCLLRDNSQKSGSYHIRVVHSVLSDRNDTKCILEKIHKLVFKTQFQQDVLH